MSTHSTDPRPIPDWRPAERVVPELLEADDLMWMDGATIDGITVQMYKHRDTRAYLVLGDDGTAYRLVGNPETGLHRVYPISLDEAKAHMLRMDEPFERPEAASIS